jgi:hypothetical protein
MMILVALVAIVAGLVAWDRREKQRAALLRLRTQQAVARVRTAKAVAELYLGYLEAGALGVDSYGRASIRLLEAERDAAAEDKAAEKAALIGHRDRMRTLYDFLRTRSSDSESRLFPRPDVADAEYYLADAEYRVVEAEECR